jgi:hypothetical protein
LVEEEEEPQVFLGEVVVVCPLLLVLVEVAEQVHLRFQELGPVAVAA